MSLYNCNHCMLGVDQATHDRHLKVYDAIMDAAAPGCDDLFVHERGHIQSFDPNGNVVVCDKCFIVELSDNLQPSSSRTSEATEEGYQAYKVKRGYKKV